MRKLKYDEFNPTIDESIDHTQKILEKFYILGRNNELPFWFMAHWKPVSRTINFRPIATSTFILDTQESDMNKVANDIKDEISEYCNSAEKSRYLMNIYKIFVYEDVWYLRGCKTCLEKPGGKST